MRRKAPKKIKKVKRQTQYHSSSEEDGDEQEIQKSESKNIEREDDEPSSNEEEDSSRVTSSKNKSQSEPRSSSEDESGSGSEASIEDKPKKRKRNDPNVFATSMSKILNSKLTTSKRSDPVLSRSKDASIATKELSEAKLEAKAKHKLREDKRAALEKGRVKDILGIESADLSTASVIEQEKRLKKTAQRGVIKLFNAVRAAQVKGEEAAREARQTGMIGMGKREEKVTEMSKKGFLDFIAGGGKKDTPVTAS